jgi:hypothetical protein
LTFSSNIILFSYLWIEREISAKPLTRLPLVSEGLMHEIQSAKSIAEAQEIGQWAWRAVL